MEIELKEAELDGKKIAYSSATEFLVQVSRSKNKKSGYRTRYRFVGNLGQAVMNYRMINVGYGYRKRLLMPSSKNPVLAREAS